MKIIHGADFHLDSPLSSLENEKAGLRRSELRNIPDRLVTLSLDFHPDVVLLSGDLLDGENVVTDTVEALTAALDKIPAPVFIAPGNHDPYSEKSVYAQNIWPDNVHIFTSNQIEKIELENCGAVIYGAAFCSPLQEESLLKGFTAPKDGRFHVMTMHAQVAGNGKSQYNPITPEEIENSGLDYLALGHVHEFSDHQKAGSVSWAYSGCPEGRGFDEQGLKGVLLVRLEQGEEPAVEFQPICSRQYLTIPVQITPEDNETSISQKIIEKSEPDHFVRVILEGERGIPELDTGIIERSCRNYFFNVSVQDQTELFKDIWDRAGEDNLAGCFLEQIRREMDAGTADPELLELAARYGIAALENREDFHV